MRRSLAPQPEAAVSGSFRKHSKLAVLGAVIRRPATVYWRNTFAFGRLLTGSQVPPEDQ